MQKSLFVVLVILLAAVGGFVYMQRGTSTPAVPDATPTLVTLDTHSNEKISALGVSITPLAVLEDSRCPGDVQCIQAGTVRVKVMLAGGLGLGDYPATLTLGIPLTTEAETITLTKVAPNKISTHSIKPSEYLFTFEIKKR